MGLENKHVSAPTYKKPWVCNEVRVMYWQANWYFDYAQVSFQIAQVQSEWFCRLQNMKKWIFITLQFTLLAGNINELQQEQMVP